MKTPHVKIGIRSSVIPLVLMVIMVVIVFTPATVVETVKAIIVNAKKSIPIPAWFEIGSMTTQPTGRPPTARVVTSRPIAATRVQRLKALSRGKAMSRAPIMMGMTKLPHGPATATIIARIMTMP